MLLWFLSLSLSLKKVSLSLSVTWCVCFFFALACFCFLSRLSLPLSLSLSSFSCNSDENQSARGFRRAPLCCSETRASTREKREREKETRERESAHQYSLPRRKFLSFALSLRHYREELNHALEYSFLSRSRRKTENSHVFPGKPSSRRRRGGGRTTDADERVALAFLEYE